MSYNVGQSNTYLASENPSQAFKEAILSKKFYIIKLLSTISAGSFLLGLIFFNIISEIPLGIVLNAGIIIFMLVPLALECVGYWLLQKEAMQSGNRMENPVGLLLIMIVAICRLVGVGLASIIAVVLFFITMFGVEMLINNLDFLQLPVETTGGVIAVILLFAAIFAVCFLMILFYIKKIKMLSALKSMMIGERLRANETLYLSEYVAYTMFFFGISGLSSVVLYVIIFPVAASLHVLAAFLILALIGTAGCSNFASLMIAIGIFRYNKKLAVMNAASSLDSVEIGNLRQQNESLMVQVQELQRQLMDRTTGESERRPGTITGIGGTMHGALFDISDGAEYYIGRDPKSCSIVISSSYAKVSKRHCGILYDRTRNVYKVVDYSTNGTFRGDGKRLVAGKYNLMNAGATITLANTDNKFVFN